MIRNFVRICCVVCGFAQIAMAAGDAAFTVKVVDEAGNPVPGAPVIGTLFNKLPHHGVTDSKGELVIQADGVRFWYATFSVCLNNANGYYESYKCFNFQRVVNGRWQPWNPTVTALVRRISHPIPMYVKFVQATKLTTNQWYGFDLTAGDFVQPYGNGAISDLVFRVSGFFRNYRDNDSVLTLRFANPTDGMQQDDYQATGSTFLMHREAPTNGYAGQLSWRVASTPKEGNGNDEIVDDLKSSPGYLFRVRSATNDQGVITKAYYGKIRAGMKFSGIWPEGSSLSFLYYLNPTPNDRNLEFDPKRNLLQNLQSTEFVDLP